jgi:hypothetical protein
MKLQLQPSSRNVANDLDLEPNDENNLQEIEGRKAMQVRERGVAPESAFDVPPSSKAVVEDEQHRILTWLDEEGKTRDQGKTLELPSGHYKLNGDGTHIYTVFE